MDAAWTARDEKVSAFLNGEHFRFRRDSSATRASNEVELAADWSLKLAAPPTPLTERMLRDFHQFCDECLQVSFDKTGGGSQTIVWRLSDPLAIPFDRKNPEVESFQIRISEECVEICARHERGLLQGTHYLEWMMADRGGPFLRVQSVERTPSFMPRISNGVFVSGHQTLKNPGQFSDEYLGLMSHYGVNGIHLYLDLWTVFQSETLAELNPPDFDEQIAALRAFNERLLSFGIDLYLHINTPPLLETHAVFAAHPEVRGSRVEIFMEELSGRPWYNLCSGSPKVHAAYSETLTNLFTAAPEVAGMMMIVGGECFFHCYTRPAESANGDTNCPHCRGKSASREVAALTNLAAKAVKKTGTHKTLFAWPYSALIWSAQDPAELEWIRNLDESVSVLANFDCGDVDESVKSGVRFFDYNIKCIGPSETFSRQASALEERGRPIFSKIETCTTADAFFLPNLPLYFRWYARFAQMKRTGVAGFVGQWRFFGMNGSPPEELQYRLNWQDDPCEELLRLRCRRDYQLDSAASEEVVEGWRQLSAAWENYPYSAMTGGERAGYMRGPFYLGTAHPLIFDVQDTYKLPEAFFLLRGDLKELAATEEEMRELQRNAKPRYVSDLLVTLPFGVERYLELVKACRTQWDKGLALLRQRLSDQGERARLELNVCETIGAHLRSLENVVRFYAARDLLQNVRSTVEEFKSRLGVLREIMDDEIANAESMLPILESDCRIGYGHCYGEVYDAEMVRAKITQCRYVRDIELPRFSKVTRFHVWGESP